MDNSGQADGALVASSLEVAARIFYHHYPPAKSLPLDINPEVLLHVINPQIDAIVAIAARVREKFAKSVVANPGPA